MKILGVDPGSNLGMALVVDGAFIDARATGCTFPNYVNRGVRLADRMVEYWEEVLLGSKPDLVMLEGYAYGQNHTLAILVTIGTILRLWCDIHGVRYLEIAPSSLKKFTTGKGNAKKEVMKLEVYKRFGVEAETNDEIDAIALALFGACLMGELEQSLPETHLSPIKNIQKSPAWRSK